MYSINTIGVSIVLSVCLLAIGCAGPANKPQARASDSTIKVDSLDFFNAFVVDKTLIGTTVRGQKSPDTQIRFTSDGKVVGFTGLGNIDLDWSWEDGSVCRSGIVGLPEHRISLPSGCQTVTIKKGVVTFERASGQARRAVYFVE